MQEDLVGDAPMRPVHLFGVNAPGTESGVPEMVDGRMLPLLQDTLADGVAGTWEAKHFDLVVLDARNVVVAVLPLLENDLTDPASYEAVRAMLLEIAAGP